MRSSFGLSLVIGLGLIAGSASSAFGQVIDFESQCPSGMQSTGPCSALYSTVGNSQMLNISTTLGTVTVSGGAVFDQETNVPADETVVYGTAGGDTSGLGISSIGTGFTNPITITFPSTVHNFYLTVLNGNTSTINYTVADNNGNSATYSIAPNLSGGENVAGFAASGNVVTISAVSGLTAWDFLIDNITVNQGLPPGLDPISTTGTGITPVSNTPPPSPTPTPASLILAMVGLVAVGLYLGWKHSRRGGTVVLLLAVALLIPAVSYSAGRPIGVMGVRGVWQLRTSQGTVTLTIDRQTGDLFSGAIAGDDLRGTVSGQVRGRTMIFDRTPLTGQLWPSDGTGSQKQSYSLEIAPGAAGAPMNATGSWTGYRQGNFTRSSAGLTATAHQLR